ncbi:MAG: NAD-dependent epimerase/dehydratase family protein [Elusimicrobia bacterium]|nr:NAD-dependent epimerase/dehydratase family protein [Elusimicrobiota bacterium]
MSARLVVLVTGASGRIGRSLVRLLAGLGVERRCVDVALVPDDSPCLHCDIADASSASALLDFCKPVTHVVHLASRAAGPKDPAQAYGPQFRLEVLGTLNLLRALPPDVRHVAYASSMTVYGAPERLPVAEDQPLRPECVCALCKIAVEQHLEEYSRARGVPACALRLSSVYGPGASRGSAIGAMIERALRGEPPEVHGDGSARRDYLYVDDACRAFLAAALHGVRGALNVGTGVGTSAAELAGLIARLAGLDRPPVFVPRERGSASLVFDIRRLAGATRFSPRVSLEDGLSRTLADLRGRGAGGSP